MEAHPHVPDQHAIIFMPPPPRPRSASAGRPRLSADRLGSVAWLSDAERQLAADLPPGPLVVGLERRLAEQLARLEAKIDRVVGACADSSLRATGARLAFAEVDGEERAGGAGRRSRLSVASAHGASPARRLAKGQRTMTGGIAELLAEVGGRRGEKAPGRRKPCRQSIDELLVGVADVSADWVESAAQKATVSASRSGRTQGSQRSGPEGRLTEMSAEVDGKVPAQGTDGRSRSELREAAGAPEHTRPVGVPAGPAQRSAVPASTGEPEQPADAAQAATESGSSAVFKKQLKRQMTKGELVMREIERNKSSGEIDGETCQSSNRVSQFTSEVDRTLKLIKHAAVGDKRGPIQYGVVGKVVASSQFDFAVTLVVLLNSLIIGAQVQYSSVSNKSLPAFELAEYLCTIVFTVEICARLAAHRSYFFFDRHERWWNMFDLFLVGLCLLDAVISFTVGTEGGVKGLAGKIGRIIRLLRIMRIIRVVRKLTQLRVMLHMIIGSLQLLFWVLLILLGVIYMVSIILTQGASEYLYAPDTPTDTDEYEQVNTKYGSLFSTMYTLFQCMSGGLNWGEASKPLRGPGWMFEAMVIGYVFFMVFAVFNIVNGVFVDGAIELSKRDRAVMKQKYEEDHTDKEIHAVNLMMLMDKNGDQVITFQEFLESLEEEEVRDYIAALEVDVTDAKVFFQMLDRDGSGEVDILEFTSGMRKFRGEAKSVDIHMMLHQNKQLFRLITCLVGALWSESADEEMLSDGDARSTSVTKQR